MVLGFISLLLTFGQNYIASICVPSRYGHAMSFCGPYDGPSGEGKKPKTTDHLDRHLLSFQRRVLADAAPAQCKKVKSFFLLFFLFFLNYTNVEIDQEEELCRCCLQGYVPLISLNALHQVHIFIFFLAVFHVIYSAITMMLGRAKVYNVFSYVSSRFDCWIGVIVVFSTCRFVDGKFGRKRS